MNYIEAIATEIRGEVPNEVLPGGDIGSLFLAYAVLLLAKGTDVTDEDVHNAWVAWMTDRGQAHASMVQYAQLPAATRTEDSPFVRAIRQVAVAHSV